MAAIAKSRSYLSDFRQVLVITFRRYSRDALGQRAVALTYYTFFAIVPIAALLFGIAKGFDLEDTLRETLFERFADHRELLNYVYRFADTTLRRARGGIVAGAGVVALIWTAMWLAVHVERAFNEVWGLPARRNLLRRFNDYLAVIVLTPVLLVIMSSAGVVLRSFFNRAAEALPVFNTALGFLFNTLADLTPLTLACVIFSCIYFFAPNTRVRILPALVAGIFAGICYQALQDGFIILQRWIYRYNRIYGSFAVLPLFLIWVQWSWQILLFGAEMAFVAQNLHSGLFVDDVDEHSLEVRRLRQLTIAALVFANVDDGKGATGRREISERLQLPPVVLDNELGVLTASGILCLTADDRVLPGVALDRTRISDCLSALEHIGDSTVGTVLAAESKPVSEALKTLAAAVASSPANRPLREIRLPEPAAGNGDADLQS